MLVRNGAARKTLPEVQKLKGGVRVEGEPYAFQRKTRGCRAFVFPMTCGEADAFSTAKKQAGMPTGVYSLIILGGTGSVRASLQRLYSESVRWQRERLSVPY